MHRTPHEKGCWLTSKRQQEEKRMRNKTERRGGRIEEWNGQIETKQCKGEEKEQG